MRTRFTPAQANRTLPLVRRIVADILEKGRERRALVDKGRKASSQRVRELERELSALMQELQRVGCYYKDWGFEMGLVDFPSEIDGREVFLCWRSDEPRVGWYHPIEEGFAGRRPIPGELLEKEG